MTSEPIDGDSNRPHDRLAPRGWELWYEPARDPGGGLAARRVLYSGDAGTARDLPSTLLGGMITMASLVVSITVVVLSLAANQVGSRLIYSFIAGFSRALMNGSG